MGHFFQIFFKRLNDLSMAMSISIYFKYQIWKSGNQEISFIRHFQKKHSALSFGFIYFCADSLVHIQINCFLILLITITKIKLKEMLIVYPLKCWCYNIFVPTLGAIVSSPARATQTYPIVVTTLVLVRYTRTSQVTMFPVFTDRAGGCKWTQMSQTYGITCTVSSATAVITFIRQLKLITLEL